MKSDDQRPPNTAPELWLRLKPLARQLRGIPTPAENHLWHRLRQRRFKRVRFRRQDSIDRFIVDFSCPAANLIVEIDGAIRDYTPEEDAIRQEFLEASGFTILRFSNGDVLLSIEAVLKRIGEVLQDTLPAPAPSP